MTVSLGTRYSDHGAASLTVRWAAVTGATSYNVKRTVGGVSIILTTQQLTIDLINLPGGTKYTFEVRARGAGGPSPWSSPVSQTTPLAAPGWLDDEALTDTSVTLTWNAVAGATSYEVKQGDGTATAASGPGTKHLFSPLTANTEYTLYVRSKKDATESPWSAALTVTTGPATPTGLNTTATSSSLALSWSAVTDATGYEVRLGEDGLVATVPSGTSHTIIGLAAGTQYSLNVRATNRHGPSGWMSTTATTTLPAPTGLTTTGTRTWTADHNWNTATRTTLSWNSVAGARSYEVMQGPSGGTVTTASGTSHTFTTGPSNSGPLYIRAKNSNGTSRWAAVSMPGVTPTPHALSVSTTTNTSLTLSWGSAVAANQFHVKIGAGGTVATVWGGGGGAGSTGTHTFPSLTPDTEHTLYVRTARQWGGNNMPSDWIWIRARTNPTATATGLSAPNGLNAGPTWAPLDSTSLTLRWSAVTDATAYDVKLGTEITRASGTSHEFTDLDPDTEYTLYVRSRSATSISDWRSITVSTAP